MSLVLQNCPGFCRALSGAKAWEPGLNTKHPESLRLSSGSLTRGGPRSSTEGVAAGSVISPTWPIFLITPVSILTEAVRF